MKTVVDLECPYCGMKSSFDMPLDRAGIPITVPCNIRGGCGLYYAIRVSFPPVVQTYALREIDLSDVSPASGKSQETLGRAE